jgi:hypothetical protein
MTDEHWDALVGPARAALEDLLWAGDDMADRIEELKAENITLRSMVADVIADTGDDPEIMAASRAEWAARALAAEAKLAKVQARLERIAAADTQAWALHALADIKGDK